MKQYFTFVKKEFLHVFRDPKTLLILFGLPLAQILLFGFALTNEIKDSRIVVCDYARDDESQRLIRKLAASDQLEVERSLMSSRELEAAFREGKIRMAVVIPDQFGADLAHGKQAQVQVIADATDPNTATTLTSYVQAIVADFQQEINPGPGLRPPVSAEIRMLYNPELKGAPNFVPGVMALVLMLVCVLMTSVSIVKEKELGTMEVLLVSPFSPFLVIIAKATPYFLLSLGNVALILSMSVFLLDLPINGSIALLFAESALLILASLSLGLLISNSTNSQQTAMLISLMGMMIPVMILTGFMFPIENMPYPLQLVSNIVPSKWYYIIVKSIMIKGLGFSAIWKETVILAGMTAFLLLVSFRKFKTRLE